MKSFLLAAAFVSVGLAGYAQCEKKVVLTSSKTEHLGADSAVQQVQDEKTTIEFDKSIITISPGNENTMNGTVNSYTCNWSVPYKTGKTQLKVTLTNPQGETQKVTITITGKDGKITLVGELDEKPELKIRLYADTFTEKS
jgi:hypothetical protein